MKKILNEWNRYLLKEVSQFSDILRTLTGQRQTIDSIGIMTPENPNAQQLQPEENDALIESFIEQLRKMNLGFRKIRGKFGNDERSFIIPNISRSETVQLGIDFGQQAVIWGSKQNRGMVYEYIENGKTLQKRDVVLTGDEVDDKEDFFSQEPGGPKKHSITYPKKGKGRPLTRTARKFIIPFFDSEYEFEEELSEGNYSELSESTEKALLEDLRARVRETIRENVTLKHRYQNRIIIKYYLEKRSKKQKQ
jgi:hypothetical protein